MGDVPGTMYGTPRTFGTRAPVELHTQNMMPFQPTAANYGFAQHQLYVNRDPDLREIHPGENWQHHWDRIKLGEQAMLDMTRPDMPIWAKMSPFPDQHTATFFSLYLHAFEYTNIEAIVLWVDVNTPALAEAFAAETIKSKDAIMKWWDK
ncbi:unnamed protein product [marine sediment metagenome]|uniref:Uncharacterized protein n=1 Tax=marine sediment metagenome TaxID=412755 RepID=X0WSV1_9ZZZZ